jgi:hypothetical protein
MDGAMAETVESQREIAAMSLVAVVRGTMRLVLRA